MLEGAHITGIGKELVDFNAIDCGVFRLDARFFEAMECAIHQGKESISAGIRHLIEKYDAVIIDGGRSSSIARSSRSFTASASTPRSRARSRISTGRS